MAGGVASEGLGVEPDHPRHGGAVGVTTEDTVHGTALSHLRQ